LFNLAAFSLVGPYSGEVFKKKKSLANILQKVAILFFIQEISKISFQAKFSKKKRKKV